MLKQEITDCQLSRIEAVEISRRRLIRDVCAATGWVFLHQASLSMAAERNIVGDPNNGDKAWGSVKGRLVFEGDVPPVKQVELEKLNLAPNDLKWFKSMGPVINQEWVIDPKSKSIQWVYVWLLPEEKNGELQQHQSLLDLPKERKLVVVDQEPTGYVPHAVGVQPGQGILMRNKGPIAHVFNLTAFKNESSNRTMGPAGNVQLKASSRKQQP